MKQIIAVAVLIAAVNYNPLRAADQASAKAYDLTSPSGKIKTAITFDETAQRSQCSAQDEANYRAVEGRHGLA